jgi:uncharacterized protein
MRYCLTLARAIVPSTLGCMVVVTTWSVSFAQSGPSFNCAGKLTAIEMVICRNIELSSLDRQLTSAYTTLIRESVGYSVQLGLRDEQRKWMQQRGTCSTDEACIASKYRSRIEQIQQQLAGSSTAEGSDSQAQALPNICPPPARWVSQTQGYMCQCPDGTFLGVGGSCRSPQQASPAVQDRGQPGVHTDDSVSTPPAHDSQTGAAAIQMRPRKFECRMEAWADRYNERNIDIYYTEEPSEAPKFDDESLARAFVLSSAQTALRYCSQQPHFGGNHMPAPIPATQVTVHVGELAFGYISSNETELRPRRNGSRAPRSRPAEAPPILPMPPRDLLSPPLAKTILSASSGRGRCSATASGA